MTVDATATYNILLGCVLQCLDHKQFVSFPRTLDFLWTNISILLKPNKMNWINHIAVIAEQKRYLKMLQYLVGLSDQFTDIHIEVGWFIIIAHWRLLHCWRQRAVFVCHTIKESEQETTTEYIFTAK